MFRVLIGGFKQETNTFSKGITDEAAFKKRYCVRHQELMDFFQGTKAEIGGFLDVLQPAHCEIIPSVAADAMPGPTVAAEFYDKMTEMLLEDIRAAWPIDGVLLMLHGAMVAENTYDGEGDLLARIRKEFPGLPICATLDMHANMTQTMIDNATALFAYDTYPHVDMYERGLEAATCLLNTLEGKCKPVMYLNKLPLILPGFETGKMPFLQIMEKAFAIEKEPGIIAASVLQCFKRSDSPIMGASVFVVADADAELAKAKALELGELMWSLRKVLIKQAVEVEQAVAMAKAATAYPVVMSDGADNPGSGGPCDGTQLLAEMLRQGVEEAAFALIADPESVDRCYKAGVGQRVQLELGGKTEPAELHGEPLKVEAYVKRLCDGIFKNTGKMRNGQTVYLGRTAVVQIAGIEVIVAENRVQPIDLNMLYSCGINPLSKRVIAVKSVVHFRAAFEPIAAQIIDVDLPGVAAFNIHKIPYKNISRPIYPLDEL